MPTNLQNHVVNWYHMYLLYPVMDFTEETILFNITIGQI